MSKQYAYDDRDAPKCAELTPCVTPGVSCRCKCATIDGNKSTARERGRAFINAENAKIPGHVWCRATTNGAHDVLRGTREEEKSLPYASHVVGTGTRAAPSRSLSDDATTLTEMDVIFALLVDFACGLDLWNRTVSISSRWRDERVAGPAKFRRRPFAALDTVT